MVLQLYLLRTPTSARTAEVKADALREELAAAQRAGRKLLARWRGAEARAEALAAVVAWEEAPQLPSVRLDCRGRGALRCVFWGDVLCFGCFTRVQALLVRF